MRRTAVCGTPATSPRTITADAAGTFGPGDPPVNRIGLGAMRLAGSAAFHPGTGNSGRPAGNMAAGAPRLADGEPSRPDALHTGST